MLKKQLVSGEESGANIHSCFPFLVANARISSRTEEEPSNICFVLANSQVESGIALKSKNNSHAQIESAVPLIGFQHSPQVVYKQDWLRCQTTGQRTGLLCASH